MYEKFNMIGHIKPLVVGAILVTLVIFFTVTEASAAECIMSGVKYPPGTVIGSLVCGDDGKWKVR